MTSKLKCPFCGEELYDNRAVSAVASRIDIYLCVNSKCGESDKLIGTKELWQALIRRTNQLNIAITDIHHAYKSLMGGCAEWRLYLEQTLKQIQDLDNDK